MNASTRKLLWYIVVALGGLLVVSVILKALIVAELSVIGIVILGATALVSELMARAHRNDEKIAETPTECPVCGGTKRISRAVKGSSLYAPDPKVEVINCPLCTK